MTVAASTLQERVAAEPDLGWRLQLAFAGLHPQTTRALLDERGPEGAVARVASAPTGNERTRRAVVVPAVERARELAAAGFAAVFRGGEGYPERLERLPGSPDVLLAMGSIPVAPAVAVVGTRRCTAYGRHLATAYGRAIADSGWTLVSGLARGIDGAAHRGTVAAGGRGVAVLGCGLDVAYPREHARLRDELLALSGAVVSEYPPGTPPEAWRFPPRNRIISGLAAAVVVVEANERGGAQITAGAALEHGIPVFAVPGDVGRDASHGCNLLIRDGAHPVLDPDDLIDELGLVLGPPARTSAAAPGPTAPSAIPVEGVDVDTLATTLDMTPAEALAAVSRWETAGAAHRRGDHLYRGPKSGDR